MILHAKTDLNIQLRRRDSFLHIRRHQICSLAGVVAVCEGAAAASAVSDRQICRPSGNSSRDKLNLINAREREREEERGGDRIMLCRFVGGNVTHRRDLA